jgi:hypothetical protein
MRKRSRHLSIGDEDSDEDDPDYEPENNDELEDNNSSSEVKDVSYERKEEIDQYLANLSHSKVPVKNQNIYTR